MTFAKVPVRSDLNSTSDLLTSGATFSGEYEPSEFNAVLITLNSDIDCSLHLDFDHDENSPYHVAETIFCEANQDHELMRFMAYRLCKVSVENISLDDATRFELVTTFDDYAPGSHPTYPSSTKLTDEHGHPADIYPLPESPTAHGLVVYEASAYFMRDTLDAILQELKVTNFHLAQMSGVDDITKDDI